MRKYGLMILMALTAATGYAQQSFVPGYYITQDGQRTEGQVRIRNSNWGDNPKSFEYRSSDAEKGREADLTNILELGLNSGEVYRRYNVFIDRSSEDYTKLTRVRTPEFVQETLFLTLVVSGKTSLFQYDEGNLHRFFYSIDQAEPKQLIYKKYLTPNGEVTVNEGYKQQLFNDLKCETITKKEIESLKYEAKDLKAMFLKFASCKGENAAALGENEPKGWLIHLTIRAGLSTNSLNVKNVSIAGSGGTADMEGTSLRAGLEMEAVFPIGGGNLSVPIEISYLNFSSQVGSGSVSATYAPIDIQLGLRKYFPVSETGRLYLSGYFVLSIPQNSKVTIVANTFKLQETVSYAIAGGYKEKRFSAEIYASLPRTPLSNNTYDGKFSGYAINLGYVLTK